MGVAGDELHPSQAAGGQVAEETEPAGTVFGAGDLQTQDLAVPVLVHARREERVDVGDTAALADLQHQGIGGDERVGAGVEGAGAELLDLLVEVLGHDRHLRLGETSDTEGLD
ncbi:hypothetical protein RCH22_004267 [Cryobacterium psychrotolerans]|nr:hypothetical protein [Cryobacterium psychrotolerans]